MPRIRTIKPEFWSSPDTASASAVARLTYIGMWNWADDYGRGTLNLKELEGFIFPNDDVSELSVGTSDASEGSSATFRRVVKEVVGSFGLTVYEVDRRLYYEIPSWGEHQRTERKAKSKFPAPSEGKNVTDLWVEGTSETFRRAAKENVGTSDANEGSSGIGTGEQGNREQGKEKTPSKPSDGEYSPAFEEWWKLYPRRVGKQAAFKAWSKARVGKDVLLDRTRQWAEAHERAGVEQQFIPHPATWLNRGGWDDELPMLEQKKAKPRTDLDGFLENYYQGKPNTTQQALPGHAVEEPPF